LRPVRALVGGLVVVAAVVAALTLYARVGDRSRVLVLSDTVLAGEQISDADLRVVSISSDGELASVAAAQRSSVVGMYARTRLIAGSMLTMESLQARPLVGAGRVLMSVAVPVGGVPVGLREQSRVTLVVTPGDVYGDVELPAGPVLVEAVVAAVPRNLAELVGGDAGSAATVSLSVEVDESFVALVGSAAAVGVGVLDPVAPAGAAVAGTVEDPVSPPPTSATPTTTAPGLSATPGGPGPSSTVAAPPAAGSGSSGSGG
jgi:hypothetical protein